MPRKTSDSARQTPDPVSTHVSERVRTLRQERGWSLESLAAISGVSRSMLSQIERQQANPTLAVTCRIAQAFGMTLAEFVETPGVSAVIQVIRAEDRAHLYRSDKSCEIRTLSPLHLEKDVEFYQVRLKPGGGLSSAPHFERTREFVTVEQGRVRVRSAEDTVDLHKGDSASYRADVPHALENTGKTDALLFLVVIYQ